MPCLAYPLLGARADARASSTRYSTPMDLDIEPRLAAIMARDYPRFSDAEYARRHQRLADVMAKAGVDHLLVITDHRSGNAPQWVTGWPGTVEAYVVFKPGERMAMFMEWYNHFPLAKRMIGHAV